MVEFDSPSNLKENPNSKFSKMLKNSLGDVNDD
jgi:flagellar hook-basal body complex protein FliE